MAARFDEGTLQTDSHAVDLISGINAGVNAGSSVAPVSASSNGILVYEQNAETGRSKRMLWFDRSGKQIGALGDVGYYETPSISPRGDKIAVSVGDSQTPGEIWVYDIADSLKRRLTFSGYFNVAPTWSADEKVVAFLSNREGTKIRSYQ